MRFIDQLFDFLVKALATIQKTKIIISGNETINLNPAGTVHGGMLATLVDTTMGAAVRSAVDDEVRALFGGPIRRGDALSERGRAIATGGQGVRMEEASPPR